jgi:hypothetical protein
MTDEIFQTHANTIIRSVTPGKDVNYLINIFLKDASINMGSDFSEETLERAIYIIKADFSYLPVSFVASAFVQGSMGKFGPGRLVPRVINGWLSEVSADYNRKRAHDEINQKPNNSQSLDLIRYPAGKAMTRKMDWLNLGVITEQEYDRIPLKEVAERIAQGLDVVPELWGIKSRKPILEN